MTETTWRTIAIILVIIICIALLYFLIKGIYDNKKYITLTKIYDEKPGTLNNLLKKINTAKRFKKKKLQQSQLTEILWAGYGKTRNDLKTVLSLSGHPLQLYICINENDIGRLDKGLYEYKPEIHNLEKIESNGLKDSLIKILGLKGKIPVILIISTDNEKYEEEKEKVFFDLGGITANILLKTRELKLKVKLIDKFDDKKVSDIFDLNDESAIMFILIGK